MYDWSLSASAALEDPRVVARPQGLRSRALGELEQRVEPERAVAARARVRRVAGRVPGRERADHGRPELLAQVERDVWEPEAVAGGACGRHRLGRAAGALRRWPGGILPKPKRDPDRVRPGAEQRDGAVDAAAHRNGDPSGAGRGDEDLANRRRQRLDR
jgi:hypothetical protein